MSRTYPVGECASCGSEAELPCHDWCHRCYTAWHRAGKPESGPPAPRWVRDQEGHLDDMRVLLEGGETDTEVIAARIGVSISTVRRYQRLLGRGRVTVEHEERKFKCDVCFAAPGRPCRTVTYRIGSRRRPGTYAARSHENRFARLRAERLAAQGLRLLPERVERTGNS